MRLDSGHDSLERYSESPRLCIVMRKSLLEPMIEECMVESAIHYNLFDSQARVELELSCLLNMQLPRPLPPLIKNQDHKCHSGIDCDSHNVRGHRNSKEPALEVEQHFAPFESELT